MDTKLVATLWGELQVAREAYMSAAADADRVFADVPSGLPGSDGALRIKNAGAQKTVAYRKYRKALDAYTDAVANSE